MLRFDFLTLGITTALIAGTGVAARAAASVAVLHAGSFTTVFNRALVPAFLQATGLHAEGEGRGSVANARLIAQGLKNPDVFISSDAQVLRDLLAVAPAPIGWGATFATTRVAIGYSPKSPHAADLAAAAAGRRRWVDVLRTPGLRLGRTDPAIDPLGYRTLIVGELAERLYREPGLGRALFGDDRNAAQTFTDEALLVRLETGELDAGFVYGIEAIGRGLPLIDLPPEINLGDAREAAAYARATVTVEGVARAGAPIEYAAAIPTAAPNPAGAIAFLRFLTEPAGRAILDRAGFTTQTPAFFGDPERVPAALRESAR